MDNSIEGYHFDLLRAGPQDHRRLIDFKQYSLTAHGKWWTYMAPPNAGAEFGLWRSPWRAPAWQTDWFFNIGIWPNTTFYCFPFTDMVAHLHHDPAGAGEVAAALRLLRAGAAACPR